jgi:hypothetical protein
MAKHLDVRFDTWHRLDSTNQNDKMQHFGAISKKNGPKWQKNCKICYSLARACFRAFWASGLTSLLTLLFHFETLRRKQNRSHDARSVCTSSQSLISSSSRLSPPLRHSIIQPSSRDDGHVSGNNASCVAIEWCDWNWNLIWFIAVFGDFQ